jgi:hypothetical protein
MPGDSFYWRFTLAIQRVNTEGTWLVTLWYTNKQDYTRSLEAEEAAIYRDVQLKGILREGLRKKGALPYVHAMIALNINGTAHYYPLSWAFLQSLK